VLGGLVVDGAGLPVRGDDVGGIRRNVRLRVVASRRPFASGTPIQDMRGKRARRQPASGCSEFSWMLGGVAGM
jgi:hypothetical protein